MILTSHLSHLINETENGMSSTSLPSRGLPGKLYQLIAHSWVVSDPEVLEYRLVAGIFFTLQGHFGELTFFQFFSLIIKEEKLKIGKPRNVPTFSGVQLVDQIQEMLDQPTSRHRPSIQLMAKASIFSISPVFFAFEKQRISMDFPKKTVFFLLVQLQTAFPTPTKVDVCDHEDVPRRWQMIVAVMFRKMRIMPSSP